MKVEIKMRNEDHSDEKHPKNIWHLLDLILETETSIEALLLKDFDKNGYFNEIYESHVKSKWENERLILTVDHSNWQKYKGKKKDIGIRITKHGKDIVEMVKKHYPQTYKKLEEIISNIKEES